MLRGDGGAVVVVGPAGVGRRQPLVASAAVMATTMIAADVMLMPLRDANIGFRFSVALIFIINNNRMNIDISSSCYRMPRRSSPRRARERLGLILSARL